MQDRNYPEIIAKTVDRLVIKESYDFMYHDHRSDIPLPKIDDIRKAVEICRAIIFPGFYGSSTIDNNLLRYHIGMYTERLFECLKEQVRSAEIAAAFVEWLPQLRDILAQDVVAMYNGDPAATTYGEVISCYPSIRAVSNYRIAHRLVQLGVPLIPRIITELAHSETGIDIHPCASIGHHFTIDHGTGVVIGETCVIGNNVKLYQGVTLGAKNFPLDDDGNPIKGIARHPVIEDDVIVYANATILGRVTIGRGAVIGGNMWVTESVPPGTILVRQ